MTDNFQNNIHKHLYERFNSVEELDFLDTERFEYFVGSNPDGQEGDEPIQIRVDKKEQKIFYRSPTDESWIEETVSVVLDSKIIPEHRELMEIIADQLKETFQAHNVWENVTIFFNNCAYMGGEDEVHEYIDPSDYVELHNADTVTVSYAGPLKTVMYDGITNEETGITDYSLLLDVKKIIESYGYRMTRNEEGFIIYRF